MGSLGGMYERLWVHSEECLGVFVGWLARTLGSLGGIYEALWVRSQEFMSFSGFARGNL